MASVRKKNKRKIWFCNLYIGCRRAAKVWNICADYPDDPNWDCTQYRMCKKHDIGFGRFVYDERVMAPYFSRRRVINWKENQSE